MGAASQIGVSAVLEKWVSQDFVGTVFTAQAGLGVLLQQLTEQVNTFLRNYRAFCVRFALRDSFGYFCGSVSPERILTREHQLIKNDA